MRRAAWLVAAVLVGCGGRPPSSSRPELSWRDECPGATVADLDELRALSGCRLIIGDLTITGATLETLAGLESVQIVEGTLTIGPTTSLLAATGLNRLRATRAVRVEDNALLTSAAFPQLSSVRGAVAVDSNARLALVSAPLLSWADSIDVANNPTLIELHLPQLQRLPNGARISDNRVLRWIGLPALERAGELVVSLNPALLDVVAPTLRVIEGGLEIELNQRLTGLQLPVLKDVGGVVLIADNESFPTAAALGLAEAISMKGSVRIHGNAQ